MIFFVLLSIGSFVGCENPFAFNTTPPPKPKLQYAKIKYFPIDSGSFVSLAAEVPDILDYSGMYYAFSDSMNFDDFQVQNNYMWIMNEENGIATIDLRDEPSTSDPVPEQPGLKNIYFDGTPTYSEMRIIIEISNDAGVLRDRRIKVAALDNFGNWSESLNIALPFGKIKLTCDNINNNAFSMYPDKALYQGNGKFLFVLYPSQYFPGVYGDYRVTGISFHLNDGNDISYYDGGSSYNGTIVMVLQTGGIPQN